MKVLALFLFAASALGQQVTIPSQQVTIPAQTVTLPASGTIPANVVTLNSGGQLVVNGAAISPIVTTIGILGTSLPNGVYGVHVTNNAIDSIAALPASSTPVTTASGATYTVSAPAQAIYAVAWLPVPGLTVQKGQTWSVTPVFTGAPNPTALNYLQVQAFVNSAGAMYLRVSASAAIPAMSYTVNVK